jgi:serine/threonine-protein kinase
MEETLTGKTIGRYKIEERLGRGGMAEVYKGYQESLDRHVAIKVMHTFLSAETAFLQRFKRAARAMASLSHPNIVRVYDFDVYGQDSYYLVMEYIDGGTLKDELEALAEFGQQFPLPESVKMMADVADALAYAHRRGMIHRDIKPANIMLRKETGQAVLTDFGIVKLMGDQSMSYTATGALIGTPSYMSPEQALGKPGDERVDIYALGVLLFQMVTNQLPFAADTPLAVVLKHVNEPIPIPATFNPDVPLDLQTVIIKAMAKNPEERFQTAVEMAAALRSVNWAGPKAETIFFPVAATTGLPAADLTALGTTVAASTAVLPDPAQTIAQPVEEQTAVAQTMAAPTAVPVPVGRQRPLWLYAGLGMVLLLVIGAILFATGVIGGDDTEPTNVPVVIVEEETDTPEPTDEPEEAEATEAPNTAATQLAQLSMDLTKEAGATNTPTDTPEPDVISSPTADLTATFLAACTREVELVSATRGTANSNFVFPGSDFAARWLLENQGTCPWAEALEWTYVEGETFGYDDEPIALETAVLPGEQATLTAELTAPNQLGTYESTWQLLEPDGDPFGPPVTFVFQVVPRTTPTPSPSLTPPPTLTSEAAAGQAAYIITVESCEYPGDGPDWRCRITITPYLDGSDQIGNFTVFVFDLPSGQPAEYRGPGPFTHFIQSRRCAVYNHEIRVIEDTTNTEISGQIFVNPNDYFAGGCVEQ